MVSGKAWSRYLGNPIIDYPRDYLRMANLLIGMPFQENGTIIGWAYLMKKGN